MPVAPSCTADLISLLSKSGIHSPERLASVETESLPADPRAAAAALVEAGILTKFQAGQLLQGRHRGFRLGPHLVLDHLGRGGMGAVFLAEHQELRRKVAIKVLIPPKDEDQHLAGERFLREARAAAALDHPNIVRIFDVARHNTVPYLVMEFVDGETLQQTIDRSGALPYTAAVDAVSQAAAGLQHAYEKGFVHRDIKPGNLIRDNSGVVKILDMGLARAADNQEDRLTEKLDAGAVVGTADFIAPEQALSSPAVDIRADIYSLGATFFALVTGKPPFAGNTTQKLLQHQMKSAPHLSSIDSRLPKGLGAVVAKMLEKKAADRYQTPAEVIDALSPWLGNTARVLAGLSQTTVGQEADLHARVNDRAGSSSRRLGRGIATEAGPDSGEVDPSRAADDTVVEASGRTARSPMPQKPVKVPMPLAKWPVSLRTKLIAGGVGLAAIMGFVGALAFGGGNRDPEPQPSSPQDASTAAVAPAPAPVPPPPKPPEPKPQQPVVQPKNDPPPPPPPPMPTEPVLARFVPAGLRPFAIRSGLEMKDTQRVYKLLSKTGAGDPPTGWTARCYNVETQMEYFVDDPTSGLALRNVRGPGSAMLFMPKFESSTGACKLKIEYAASVRERGFSIRFKASDTRPAWDVVRPPVTRGGEYRYEEYVPDMKGAKGGFFEFHNTDPSPDSILRIRAVTVVEAPAGTPPTVATTTTTPAPTGPDYSKWTEGRQVYQLDLSAIPTFRITKEGGKRLTGAAEKLPAGVRCTCWKATATGEFRCEAVDGVPALGVTNLTEEKSAQFSFELEKDLNLILKPGTVYRVKLGYATRNEATGGFSVQSQDYKGVATVKLAAGGPAWRTAALNFERKDTVPVRLTIDNTSVGEGNILYVRSVEIVELVKP